MEKIACFLYIVFINAAICFGQSHKTIIPVNPIKETCIEMDSSCVTLNFEDFTLYYTPKEPFELSVHNVTNFHKILLEAGFSLKKAARNDCLKIKSVRIKYMDEHLELTRKDKLKILNHTLKLLKEKTYYVKYYCDVKQNWSYFIQIPVVIVPMNNN